MAPRAGAGTNGVMRCRQQMAGQAGAVQARRTQTLKQGNGLITGNGQHALTKAS